MGFFGLRFDLRNPDIAGTTMAERYRAAIDMAEWADGLGFVVIVLSEHHGSAEEARARLVELVRADFEKDLEVRLAALARIERRREYILEPAMRAVGFASFHALDSSCGSWHE